MSMLAFVPGQVWSYNTRPGEEASRIVICRVESYPKIGQVVHVHIDGLQLKNKRAPDGLSRQIAHLSYSAAALSKSLAKLESESESLPDFEGGYQEWRAAFDRGQAGVWTASVAETIATMESVLNG